MLHKSQPRCNRSVRFSESFSVYSTIDWCKRCKNNSYELGKLLFINQIFDVHTYWSTHHPSSWVFVRRFCYFYIYAFPVLLYLYFLLFYWSITPYHMIPLFFYFCSFCFLFYFAALLFLYSTVSFISSYLHFFWLHFSW